MRRHAPRDFKPWNMHKTSPSKARLDRCVGLFIKNWRGGRIQAFDANRFSQCTCKPTANDSKL